MCVYIRVCVCKHAGMYNVHVYTYMYMYGKYIDQLPGIARISPRQQEDISNFESVLF